MKKEISEKCNESKSNLKKPEEHSRIYSALNTPSKLSKTAYNSEKFIRNISPDVSSDYIHIYRVPKAPKGILVMCNLFVGKPGTAFVKNRRFVNTTKLTEHHKSLSTHNPLFNKLQWQGSPMSQINCNI